MNIFDPVWEWPGSTNMQSRKRLIHFFDLSLFTIWSLFLPSEQHSSLKVTLTLVVTPIKGCLWSVMLLFSFTDSSPFSVELFFIFKLGGSGIKKRGGGRQRRIDAFCDVWLSSGSRRQNPTHALSGQSNRGKFLSLGHSWRQKKKRLDWDSEVVWANSEVMMQRWTTKKSRSAVVSPLQGLAMNQFLLLLNRMTARILARNTSPAAGGYHATASAMFSTTSSRRNVLTMTIAQIRVVLTSLDTRGYIENHRQRTGEG